jgi:putative peptidoglycan lipid II flippase
VANTLAIFALGLPAFVMIKVFSPGFFAREDTRTPMLVAGAAMATNIVLSLALFPRWGETAIAFATTIAGWLNAGLLFALLVRRGAWPLDRMILRRAALTLAVSLVLAGALAAAMRGLGSVFAPSAGLLTQSLALLVLIAAGAVLYFGLAHLTGAADLRALAGHLRRRRPAE